MPTHDPPQPMFSPGDIVEFAPDSETYHNNQELLALLIGNRFRVNICQQQDKTYWYNLIPENEDLHIDFCFPNVYFKESVLKPCISEIELPEISDLDFELILQEET